MYKLGKQDLIFKALADSKRREILDLLRKKPKTTGEICSYFEPLDRCTIIQHLKILENAGLLIVKRKGRVRWNYLDNVPIQEIYDRWISKYAKPTLKRLAVFKKQMESG